MPTPVINLTLDKQAAYKLTLIWRENNRARKPINLTGYTAKLQIRDTVDGTVFIEASTTNSRIRLGTINGRIDIEIPEPIVTALTITTGVYDLVLFDPLNVPRRFIEGKVTVTKGVTRP